MVLNSYMTCGSAGIGRQARLRILWLYDRVGSSPISRINKTYFHFVKGMSFFVYTECGKNVYKDTPSF